MLARSRILVPVVLFGMTAWSAPTHAGGGYLPPVHPLMAGGDHHQEDHATHNHGLESLAGIDLSGARLSEASLFTADLTDADLTGARLDSANLRFATFTGATLVNADLREADLRHSDFRGANLTGATLAGADLTNADFTDAILLNADLTGVMFENVNLTRVDLSGVTLSGASFRFATLDEANLSGATLEGVNFTNAHADFVNMRDASLADSVFINASMIGADLTDARMVFTDLSDADLSGATLSDTVLLAANLTRAKVMGADGRGVMLFGSDLTDSDLHESDLAGGDLRFAVLRRADFTNVDLTATDLGFASFDETFLFDSNLAGADLTDATDLTAAFSDASTRYRCDTIFEGTGFDPISADWTLLPPSTPAVFYVNADGPGGCGTRWDTAFLELSDAIELAASAAGAVEEIWVAATDGPYRPLGEPGDRTATFRIPAGVSIFGGFEGTELTRDERDSMANVTMLSGQIGGETGLPAYHVVTMEADTLLDGFHVVGGRADGTSPNDVGGGLVALAGEATVRHVFFLGNVAHRGGAVFSHPRTSMRLLSCTFRDNEADMGGAWAGDEATVVAVSCLFVRNHATLVGGALRVGAGGEATLVNGTCSQNASGGVGAVGHVAADGIMKIKNSILWGNPPDELFVTPGGMLTVGTSIVDGGWVGDLNIDENPDFLNATYVLAAGSPAIDAGDSIAVPADGLTDVGGRTRFFDDPGTEDDGVPAPSGVVVDIGAWEFNGITPDPCPSDVDEDGEVGFTDLVILLSSWGPCRGCPQDLDGSTFVEFHDLLILLADWGPCP